MIKKIRRRFIIITMCSVVAVLVIITGTINVASYRNLNQRADIVLDLLAENGGNFPQPDGQKDGTPRDSLPGMSPETPYESRFFTIAFSSNGEVTAVNTGSIAAIDTADAFTYAQQIYQSGRQSGFIDDFKYKSYDTDNGGTLLVFLDRGRDLDSLRSFVRASMAVSGSVIIAVFILLLIFSPRAIKPIADSYAKQKRFITDASHEIKTPLTVIGANIDVLEMEQGANQWTKSIRNQVGRLSSLTASLISLSRLEEEQSLQLLDFSLSDAVKESVEPFAELAQSQGKSFELSVEDHISFTGDEQAIRQLTTILADNALKYASGDGEISFTVKRLGKYAEIICRNSADGIEKGNHDILFERFYRADSSHSQTQPGYGLGLSVAQAIVLAHRGRISAKSEDGSSLIISVLLKLTA
jgi:two-component system, OmpR family, sensor histidine kinase CiaH